MPKAPRRSVGAKAEAPMSATEERREVAEYLGTNALHRSGRVIAAVVVGMAAATVYVVTSGSIGELQGLSSAALNATGTSSKILTANVSTPPTATPPTFFSSMLFAASEPRSNNVTLAASTTRPTRMQPAQNSSSATAVAAAAASASAASSSSFDFTTTAAALSSAVSSTLREAQSAGWIVEFLVALLALWIVLKCIEMDRKQDERFEAVENAFRVINSQLEDMGQGSAVTSDLDDRTVIAHPGSPRPRSSVFSVDKIFSQPSSPNRRDSFRSEVNPERVEEDRRLRELQFSRDAAALSSIVKELEGLSNAQKSLADLLKDTLQESKELPQLVQASLARSVSAINSAVEDISHERKGLSILDETLVKNAAVLTSATHGLSTASQGFAQLDGTLSKSAAAVSTAAEGIAADREKIQQYLTSLYVQISSLEKIERAMKDDRTQERNSQSQQLPVTPTPSRTSSATPVPATPSDQSLNSLADKVQHLMGAVETLRQDIFMRLTPINEYGDRMETLILEKQMLEQQVKSLQSAISKAK